MIFQYIRKLRLQDTDAAGLLFFTSQLAIVQEAFEELLDSLGFNMGRLIKGKKFLLPIVHVESDYHRPSFVGDTVYVHMAIDQMRQSSFRVNSSLIGSDKKRLGTVRILHVAIDAKTRKKIPLPVDLKKELANYKN